MTTRPDPAPHLLLGLMAGFALLLPTYAGIRVTSAGGLWLTLLLGLVLAAGLAALAQALVADGAVTVGLTAATYLPIALAILFVVTRAGVPQDDAALALLVALPTAPLAAAAGTVLCVRVPPRTSLVVAVLLPLVSLVLVPAVGDAVDASRAGAHTATHP
ncbi:hypothetical protein [Nocardioides humi]|uniref:hypothetical protein n=1 Tax=Nocardioides humi TaxID=449461 RepID=UPI00112C4A1E|nr:hypothetical protein [Nocardioides humi]